VTVYVLDGVPDRQFLGFSAPLKSIRRICCGVRKSSWTDRDAILGLTHVGPRNRVLDGCQGWTNLFAAARGEKMVMLPFVKILW